MTHPNPVITFPSGPMDRKTAVALAEHEKLHLAYGGHHMPDDTFKAAAEVILAFEASHGIKSTLLRRDPSRVHKLRFPWAVAADYSINPEVGR